MYRREGWLAALGLSLVVAACLPWPTVYAATRSTARRRPAPLLSSTPQRSAVRALEREEAQRNVALLDDAYQIIIQEIHDWYPNRTGQPVVAAKIARQLQEVMVRKGWPRSRFLGVTGPLMNPDHQPRDSFEQKAVAALRAGRDRYEEVSGDRLRVATVVPLDGGCFECHWTPSKQGSRAAIAWDFPLLPKRTRGR